MAENAGGATGPDPAARALRSDVPHPARIYDHLLGGTENYPADREAAAEIVKHSPHLPESMRANRDFMARVARHLVAERGIRQFLDIGSGLPSTPNLHEVVQSVAPESRVVYVDNDPIVLVHSGALLLSTLEGRTAYVEADLREPETILTAPGFRDTLSLDRPIAVSLFAILQFVTDDDEAKRLIHRLVDPLPAGSVLALSTLTADSAPGDVEGNVAAYRSQGIVTKARTKAEVERLFDGLTLLDPGVTLVHRWLPEGSSTVEDAHVYMCGGVALKL